MFVIFIVLSAIASLACSQSSTVMPSSSTSSMKTNTWEDLVVKPVQIIAELSRVSIVMSRRDYTLDTSRPYTYIKYPASYRATLTQATDVIGRAFQTAEKNMFRMEMIMGQVSEELRTARKILFEGAIEDRQFMLPMTLDSIVKSANDVTSAVAEVLKELGEVTAFFDELLRAVQPSTPSSTSTQSTMSPLDINHATAVSNIIAHLKSLTAIWNQVSQEFSLLSLTATQAAKFIDNGKRILWLVGDMDQTTDLFSRVITSLYNKASTQIITKPIFTMGRLLMLESEEKRLDEANHLTKVTDGNIGIVQRGFANGMAAHETHNKERNEEYQRLATTL